MAQLDHAQRHFDTEQAWLMLQTIALGFRAKEKPRAANRSGLLRWGDQHAD
jgi:hypothetical protein